MNTFQLSSPPQNPFIRSPFWGRQKELRTIYSRLISNPPQCCAIIGETFIGKTTLLRHLADSQTETIVDQQENEHKLIFIYLDCSLHIDLVAGDYASVQFWWALYRETRARLHPDKKPEPFELSIGGIDSISSVDKAYEIKSMLEHHISEDKSPVIFVLDNFEEVAHLPLYNSEWLRSMLERNCAYVVASRHLLYLNYQYHWENWNKTSPLWNLFSDPIYLGLMSEHEVQAFLLQACKQAADLGSHWRQQDLDFIRRFCGRHAELMRIACKNLFESRLQSSQSAETDKNELEGVFLEFSIAKDAGIVCTQIWYGLADPELSGVPRSEGSSRKKEVQVLSPHQRGLLDIAKGNIPADKSILFVLEQRGLVERVNGEWRVFAEVMCQFVLKQEQVSSLAGQRLSQQPGGIQPTDGSTEPITRRRESPIFTSLERKVYNYLKSHIGDVCDREEIKEAVWKNDSPTNPALQKVIERIRDKIEPDPANPSYLIAIRGRGFMLREDPTGAD